MKSIALHNLGCKVNGYEMDVMQQLLEEKGYKIVPFDEEADIYIINTCTVTNIADQKSRQMLHRAKKRNPDAVVVAAGCYAQTGKDKALIDPAIDLLIGNNRKKDIADILEEFLEERQKPDFVPRNKTLHGKTIIDINHTDEYEEMALQGKDARDFENCRHTRAYIKIQDGCNQFCSYCIIPYARGRVRSRGREDVVHEVEALAKGGCREVVLAGIHLSSYGIDLADGNDLLSLVLAVHGVEGVERVRLGSLEPGIITEEFVRALAALPKVCPHFHLSLQSGCDETLRRMNRHYTSGEYYEKCLLLRKYFENPALTTDVIVGFPGETEEEFAASKAFVEKTCFYETHVFKYSRREGTRAAAMEGQVPEQVKSRRSDEMIRLGEQKQKEYEESLYGRKLEVLVEEETMAGGRAMWCGHTREYVKVALDGDAGMRNRLVKFILTEETEILH